MRIRIFTLHCVISTNKPVIRGYHCKRTRNISLSLRRTHLFAIAAIAGYNRQGQPRGVLREARALSHAP